MKNWALSWERLSRNLGGQASYDHVGVILGAFSDGSSEATGTSIVDPGVPLRTTVVHNLRGGFLQGVSRKMRQWTYVL